LQLLLTEALLDASLRRHDVGRLADQSGLRPNLGHAGEPAFGSIKAYMSLSRLPWIAGSSGLTVIERHFSQSFEMHGRLRTPSRAVNDELLFNWR
jgi:hypothetical protein